MNPTQGLTSALHWLEDDSYRVHLEGPRAGERFTRFCNACLRAWVDAEDPVRLERLAEFRDAVQGEYPVQQVLQIPE